MKKVWKMFSALLLVGLLFTGCTPKEDKAQEQSGAPIIVYEVPDKVIDYGFDFEFVPESE